MSQLVKQFGAVQRLSKQMANMGGAGKAEAIRAMGAGGMGGLMPGLGGMPGFHAQGQPQPYASGKRIK